MTSVTHHALCAMSTSLSMTSSPAAKGLISLCTTEG